MRKLFLVLVALLVVSVGNAQAWFAADAKTTNGAASVSIPIYNDDDSSSDWDAGDVIVLDASDSTGDNDLYGTRTTTADTGLVVGVVWPSAITNGNVGSVVVYGFAECDLSALGIAADSPICTSTTAGAGDACSSGTAGYRYAVSNIAGAASTQVSCFVNP